MLFCRQRPLRECSRYAIRDFRIDIRPREIRRTGFHHFTFAIPRSFRVACFGLPVWREADSDIGRSFPFCDSLGPAAGFRTRAQSGTRNSFRFRSTRFVARTPMIGKRGRFFRERGHNIGERLL
jgi:hypothetical protein